MVFAQYPSSRNRKYFVVVRSIIDTHYDVITWKEQPPKRN